MTEFFSFATFSRQLFSLKCSILDFCLGSKQVSDNKLKKGKVFHKNYKKFANEKVRGSVDREIKNRSSRP